MRKGYFLSVQCAVCQTLMKHSTRSSDLLKDSLKLHFDQKFSSVYVEITYFVLKITQILLTANNEINKVFQYDTKMNACARKPTLHLKPNISWNILYFQHIPKIFYYRNSLLVHQYTRKSFHRKNRISVHLCVFVCFFLSGFSFTHIRDSQDSRGRTRLST